MRSLCLVLEFHSTYYDEIGEGGEYIRLESVIIPVTCKSHSTGGIVRSSKWSRG